MYILSNILNGSAAPRNFYREATDAANGQKTSTKKTTGYVISAPTTVTQKSSSTAGRTALENSTNAGTGAARRVVSEPVTPTPVVEEPKQPVNQQPVVNNQPTVKNTSGGSGSGGTDYAAKTNAAVQQYLNGEISYDTAAAMVDASEAARKAKMGSAYTETASASLLRENAPASVLQPQQQQPTYITPDELNAYLDEYYSSKTVQKQNPLDNMSGTYTSPWTGNSYKYSSTEEMQDYMAYDKALYDQQVADKAAAAEKERQEALKLAVDQKISNLNSDYRKSLSSYGEQAGRIQYEQAQAGDNARLALANSGDLGGIGQKQYSDQENNYDQQFNQLVLEQQNFKNEIDQAITNAIYDGDIELANAIADAAKERLDAYQTAVDEFYANYITNSDRFYNRSVTDRNFNYEVAANEYNRQVAANEAAYERAMNNLKYGTLSADDLVALGWSENDAAYWANYYRQMAALDLATAQASLSSKVSGGGGGGGDTSSEETEASGGETNNWDMTASDYAAYVNALNGDSLVIKHGNGGQTRVGISATGDQYRFLDDNSLGLKSGDTVTLNGNTYVWSESANRWISEYNYYSSNVTPDQTGYTPSNPSGGSGSTTIGGGLNWNPNNDPLINGLEWKGWDQPLVNY